MRAGVWVLYEDNHLLGIAKQAGVLSQGGPRGVRALPDLLDAYRREAESKEGRAYIGLVHRLDRNVSGAMVVAKTSKAASRLSALFRDRSNDLKKEYVAWVSRIPEEDHGELKHRLRRHKHITRIAHGGDTDGKDAHLSYVVEGKSIHAARLRITLHSGITHQIRAQFSIVGHPLIGDEKYGGPSAKRPALHAVALSFPHPVGGSPMVIGAPIPDDLKIIDARYHIRPAVMG